MPAVRTPEASRPTRRIAVPRCSLPRREIGSATSITFDFAALPCGSGLSIRSLAFRPATFLSTLRSGCSNTTQDSIHGCLAQALPWPPFQTAELNALARRNSPQTGHEFFNLIQLSSASLTVGSLPALAIAATSASIRRAPAPFAMWTAFPSADYYGRSVTIGLAACRRSRVSSS